MAETQSNWNPGDFPGVHLFIATPAYGGMVMDEYFLSMLQMTQQLERMQVRYNLTTIRNESLITRARNNLTAMFLGSGATHLFFIDADIVFPPDAVFRLLRIDKPITAGAYSKKSINWEAVRKAALAGRQDIWNYTANYALNFKYSDPERKQIHMENGALEVRETSTGFMLIKREVFEALMKQYPDLHFRADTATALAPRYEEFLYAFFDTGIDPEDRRYLSEDYNFCRLAKSVGYSIWIDPMTNLDHVGSYRYRGNIRNYFSNMPP